jgi:hypothetical protein
MTMNGDFLRMCKETNLHYSGTVILLQPQNLLLWKGNNITGLDRAWSSRSLKLPEFWDSRHMKVVRLSALCTRCLYSSGDIPATHFCRRLGRPQGYSAARRIKSVINAVESKTVLLCISFCTLCLYQHLPLLYWSQKCAYCSISALHNTTNFPHNLAFTNHRCSYLVAG